MPFLSIRTPLGLYGAFFVKATCTARPLLSSLSLFPFFCSTALQAFFPPTVENGMRRTMTSWSTFEDHAAHQAN